MIHAERMPADRAPHALADRVQKAIVHSPYIARAAMQCETSGGRVTLRGRVGSYFQKQMAQEAVLRIDGVTEIENLLEVNWR